MDIKQFISYYVRCMHTLIRLTINKQNLSKYYLANCSCPGDTNIINLNKNILYYSDGRFDNVKTINHTLDKLFFCFLNIFKLNSK